MNITGTETKETKKSINVDKFTIVFKQVIATDENGKRYEIKPKRKDIATPEVMYVKQNGNVYFKTDVELTEL